MLEIDYLKEECYYKDFCFYGLAALLGSSYSILLGGNLNRELLRFCTGILYAGNLSAHCLPRPSSVTNLSFLPVLKVLSSITSEPGYLIFNVFAY